MEWFKCVVTYKNNDVENISCNTKEERTRKIDFLIKTNRGNIKKLESMDMVNKEIKKKKRLV